MKDVGPFSKSRVLFAMTLIRPLFAERGCDVDHYGDDEIAEALLATYPNPATHWLSSEHLSCACTQLTPIETDPSLRRPATDGVR